jgi:hypothetical protein
MKKGRGDTSFGLVFAEYMQVRRRGKGQADHKGGDIMNGREEYSHPSQVLQHASKGTRIALWWLRHYDDIAHFWRGFSWIWVIGVLFYVVVGYLDLRVALPVVFIVGVIANSGMYLGIRAISSHLKTLEDGPEKEEAHELMVKIIKKKVLSGV